MKNEKYKFVIEIMFLEIQRILLKLGNKKLFEFQNVIKNLNNSKLNGLFIYLIHNHKKEVDKGHLFRSVFNEVYSKPKDYLLRNELRLLKNQLAIFISGQVLTKDQHQLNFLKFLSESRMTATFNKEARKLKRNLEKNGEIALLEKLEVLCLDNFYRNELKGSREDFVKFNDGVKKWHELANENFVLKNRRLSVYQAYINEGFFRMGIDEQRSMKQIALNKDESNQSKYYWFKAKSLSEKDKIQFLNKALSYLKLSEMNPKLKRDEYIVISNNLSLQYFFQRNYTKSVELYEDLMKNYELPKEKEAFVVYNYVSALVKSRRHKTAEGIFNIYIKKMTKNPSTQVKVSLLYAMNLLCLGEIKKVKEYLPADLKRGSHDDYLYARLIWAIYFYMKSDMDLCERENLNLIQSVQSKAQFESYLFCAQSMNKLLRSSSKKSRLDLSEKVNIFVNDAGIRHSDILPLLWLKDELRK